MNVKAKVSKDFKVAMTAALEKEVEIINKSISEPVAITFNKLNPGSKVNPEKILVLAKEIITDAKNGNFLIAFSKLDEIENLGAGNKTINKIKEKMFESKQELIGLSFIQKAQVFLCSEKQDGLLYPETLDSLQDIVIEGDNAREIGELEKAKVYNEIIQEFASNIQKIKEFSQETKKFQKLIGMREIDQTGIIDKDTLVESAKLYAETEKILKKKSRNDLQITLKVIKNFFANIESKITGNDFKVA